MEKSAIQTEDTALIPEVELPENAVVENTITEILEVLISASLATNIPPEIPEEPPVIELPPIPPIPEYILGEGIIPHESLSGFLLTHNPLADDFAKELAKLYVEEALIEGVNHDAAFAQMCLETGYLRYGGLVVPEMNNFCGLGAIGPGQNGEWFPDPRTGVRAHIQHLKAYATTEPLNQELVDPRYIWVRYGSSPKISGLAGSWAVDLLYADKINNILERLYRFSFIEISVIVMNEELTDSSEEEINERL